MRWNRWIAASGVSLLLGGAVPAVMATPVGATVNPTIVVTTTADVIDGGDGVISLREAVALANAASGEDTIQLAGGATYELTICGGSFANPDNTVGDLNSTDASGLTIGSDPLASTLPTIHQSCPQRVIWASDGALTLDHLDLTGGASTHGGSVRATGALTLDHVDESGASAGGDANDAAVQVAGQPVMIVDSSVHDNSTTGIALIGSPTVADSVIRRTHVGANTAPTGLAAGGIFATGTGGLTLDQSAIVGNSSHGFAGGVLAFNSVITGSTITGNQGTGAGGIEGDFTMTDSQLTDNTGLSGGAFGNFIVTRSSVTGNHAQLRGGGLAGFSGVVSDSTVAGNVSDGLGGAIAIESGQYSAPGSTLELQRSTVTGNSGAGAVVVVDDWDDNHLINPQPPTHHASVVVESSTVAGDVLVPVASPPPDYTSPSASELVFLRWNGEPTSSPVGSLTVSSSVLGDGQSGTPVCALGPASPVTSGGYNFSADSSCVGEGTGDIVSGGDPGLSPLGNHGGPTLTMAPTVGSPLIDRVPAAFSTCASSFDQRGVARPIGAGCEIGAVEVAGQRFHAVDPVRILDTRPVPQRVGPLGPWTAGATHDVTVVGGLSGVPSTATAVVLNVTATGGTANGDYLSVWPAGGSQPTVSSVNVDAGKTVSNQVTVVLGTGADAGNISIFNAGGTQQVIVDVNGYYDGAIDGDGFHPLDPVRVLDSRPAPQRVGPLGTWSAGQTQDVAIGGLVGVPVDADAVVLNVTATGGTANGDYLSVWPAGGSQPVVSSLNVDAGRTVPSAVTVKLGTGGSNAGKVSIFNAGGTQDVVIDVLGYFKAGSGTSFYPVSPRRLIDSRPPPQRVGPLGPWGEDILQQVVVTEPEPGIPVGATALVANLTATGGTRDHDYLTVYPNDTGIPFASTVNPDAGQTVANAFTTRLSASPLPFGQLVVYNLAGTINVIIDISGYYA